MLGVDPRNDGAGPRPAASLADPLVVRGPNGLSNDSRDLNAGPSQLGGPARIIPIEADVQKLHALSVKTWRLYVNQLSRPLPRGRHVCCKARRSDIHDAPGYDSPTIAANASSCSV